MRDEIPWPSARSTDMVIGEAPDGVLVYDRATHHIHQLNQLAADVWNACDGHAGIAEVARRVSDRRGEAVGIETVRIAVAELERAGLLDGTFDAAFPQGRQSRRTFLRRAAATGAAVPVVISMSAPTAASAQTAPAPCVPDGQPRGNDSCCSGEVCFIDGEARCGRCTCGGRCDPGCSCASDNTCLCPPPPPPL